MRRKPGAEEDCIHIYRCDSHGSVQRSFLTLRHYWAPHRDVGIAVEVHGHLSSGWGQRWRHIGQVAKRSGASEHADHCIMLSELPGDHGVLNH